jgi:hypothetical protein
VYAGACGVASGYRGPYLSKGPPVTSGLQGFYVGNSYNASASRWLDISGNNNHATTFGTIAYNSQGVNGEDYLSGGTTAGLTVPFTIVANSYTFFHVCK